VLRGWIRVSTELCDNIGPSQRRKGRIVVFPWVAAERAGATLPELPQRQWLRYYGAQGAWQTFSYYFAFTQATNYFADKIVFIGNKPATPLPDGERDEFRTPYTRWTNESVGGVEILITEFLNLMNGDWLRRPPWWIELITLVLTGVLLGGGLMLLKPSHALWLGAVVAVLVLIGAVCLSYFTNYWFPWLIIVGGQLPCALAVVLLSQIRLGEPYPTQTPVIHVSAPVLVRAAGVGDLPDAPDYHIVPEAFAEGAYGKVWLARNAVGQWQALKVIYQSKFGDNVEPYEREFQGITSYKPISGEHPGLLRVDFVSMQKPEGYFYYVMELGDSQITDWQDNPAIYRPRDLASVRAHAPARRLPVREAIQIVVVLAEALDFLHQRGLTHRDIKPQNIIFVNGRPKLADVGLVAKVRGREEQGTYIGTPGYMPPAPETPGTREADVYGLGMVLYVISTGCDPAYFPELSTGLIERTGEADFIRLNSVILKACHPDLRQRYPSASVFHGALFELQKALENSADAGVRETTPSTKPVEGI
jgi:hypothetical protein